MKKLKGVLSIPFFIVLYSVLSFLVYYFVSRSSIYPAGSDTLNFLYKANLLYHEILKGNFYPLYDPNLYNGVQIMRLESPLALYILALFQHLAGDNIFNGYLMYISVTCFVSSINWLYAGVRLNRPLTGGFIGAISFFMPTTLSALLSDGSLPKVMVIAISPLLFYAIHQYVFLNRWKALIKIILYSLIVVLLDIIFSVMILMATVVYLVVYAINTKELQRAINVLVAVLLGAAIAGIWVFPSAFGGGLGNMYKVMSEYFFQKMQPALNPFHRLSGEDDGIVYFGGVCAVLGAFGVFFSKKESKSTFITAMILLTLTSTVFYSLLYQLPGSRFLNFIKFLPISSVMILFGFLVWKSLKKSIIIGFLFFMALDIVPSLSMLYGNSKNLPVEMRMEILGDKTLMDTAKEVTEQRIALLDGSTLGASASFYLGAYGETVASSYGARSAAAITNQNIVQLNQSVNDGCYEYLFDRALELGNDTVLLQMDQVFSRYDDGNLIDNAAEKLGYELVDSYDKYRLYHKNTYEQFGVISNYSGIAIGTSSRMISLAFPSFQETDDINISDYTYEELSQYDRVYLAGFTYDDREKAEELIKKLADNGVRVVIEADGIPSIKNTGVRTFLGVDCYPITFNNGFPDFVTSETTYSVDMFPAGTKEWGTVFLNHLDDVWAYSLANGQELDFIGTVYSENIVIIGFNLPYHYSLTRDPSVMTFLSRAFDISAGHLPEREIVPLKVTIENDTITIISEYDNVNTGLAFQDNFVSDGELTRMNNLLHVDKGTTVIHIKYPYALIGSAISLAALIFAVLFVNGSRKWEIERLEYLERHKNDSQFKSYD